MKTEQHKSGWSRFWGFLPASKNNLEDMENRIDMKLSEIKKAVAEASKQNKEAFAEISGKITDMQKQIDDLIAGASDPDVTDEEFLKDLTSLQGDAKALADIVPNPVTPPAGSGTGGGE